MTSVKMLMISTEKLEGPTSTDLDSRKFWVLERNWETTGNKQGKNGENITKLILSNKNVITDSKTE